MISEIMVDPPPGWNGNENEVVDVVWWKDYLDLMGNLQILSLRIAPVPLCFLLRLPQPVQMIIPL